MDIKIIETGATVVLSIRDPKTGCDWISDLLGNHDETPDVDDDGNFIMTQEEFNWWTNLTGKLSALEDRLHDLRLIVDNEDMEEFDVAMQIDNCDLEDVPGHMVDAMDEWEKN